MSIRSSIIHMRHHHKEILLIVVFNLNGQETISEVISKEKTMLLFKGICGEAMS